MYAKPLLLWKKIKKIQKNLKTRKQMSAILSGEIVSVYKRKAFAFRFFHTIISKNPNTKIEIY